MVLNEVVMTAAFLGRFLKQTQDLEKVVNTIHDIVTVDMSTVFDTIETVIVDFPFFTARFVSTS